MEHRNFDARKTSFFSFLSGLLVIAWMFAGPGSVPADEGHGPQEKSASSAHEEPGHGGPKAGGHEAEEKGHGMRGAGNGMGGGHGHAAVPKGLTPLQAKGFRLVSALHCNACHYISPKLEHGAGHGAGHGGVAPNLSFPGDKFQPDWLFEFLRKPHTIRPWLRIRMPDFRLTEEEAVALVKHLSVDMRNLNLPPLPGGKPTIARRTVFLAAGRKLMSGEYFDCWTCHQKGEKKPEGPVEVWAPDLTEAGRRLRPEWIARWIQNPQGLMPGTKMPTFFEDADSGPDEVLGGNETQQMYALTEYLLSISPSKKKTKSLFERAKKKYPHATRAIGAQIMNELNCAGCHDVGNMHERLEAGPPLAHEGSRVRKEWLVNFLKKPRRIRPLGYVSGRFARMPNFRLSDEEAEAIAAYLMRKVDKRVQEHAEPREGHRRKVAQGAKLFRTFRCGSCHALSGKRPKKVSAHFRGPILTRAGRRLKEAHLILWLAGDVTRSGSHLEMDAHPLVPEMGLTRKELEALAAYIVSLK